MQGCAEDLVQGAIEAGHPPEHAQFFANSQEAAKFLEGFLDAGDLLLLKGSRGVRMEKVLEAIDARHRRDAEGGDAPRSDRSGLEGAPLRCCFICSQRFGRISAR